MKFSEAWMKFLFVWDVFISKLYGNEDNIYPQ